MTNYVQGNCWVTIEIEGSQILPTYATVVPDDINNAIAWVIDQCVDKGYGLGGFTTLGLANFDDYILGTLPSPRPNIAFRRDPRCSSYP